MKARYLFEHRFLPESVFTKQYRPSFLMTLLNEKEAFLLQVIKKLWKTESMECPFNETDFLVYPTRLTSKEDDSPALYMIAIKMPEPKVFSQCSSVFICFDEEEECFQYFTKELSFDGSYLLCSWSEDRIHSNYGEAPEGNEALFEMIYYAFFNTFSKD